MRGIFFKADFFCCLPCENEPKSQGGVASLLNFFRDERPHSNTPLSFFPQRLSNTQSSSNREKYLRIQSKYDVLKHNIAAC